MIAVRAYLSALALLLAASAIAGCHKAHDVDEIYGGVYVGDNGGDGDSGDGDGDGGDGDGDSGDGDSGDGDTGDGDGTTPNPDAFCLPSDCPGPSFFVMLGDPSAEACCTIDDLCGVRLMGNCLENDAPGQTDPSCPDESIMGMSFTGCCKENGKCGVELQQVGLGCAYPSDPASAPDC